MFVIRQFRQHFEGMDERTLDETITRQIFFGAIQAIQSQAFRDDVDQPGADHGWIGIINIATQWGDDSDRIQGVPGNRLSGRQHRRSKRLAACQFTKPDSRFFAFARQADQLNFGVGKLSAKVTRRTDFDSSATTSRHQVEQLWQPRHIVFDARCLTFRTCSAIGIDMNPP